LLSLVLECLWQEKNGTYYDEYDYNSQKSDVFGGEEDDFRFGGHLF
jgi:hypothetical protein